MANALAAMDWTQLPTQLGTDQAFATISQGGDFLPRLQLFTKGKAIDKGLIRPGHWGIPSSDEAIEDLGDAVDVLPFARRTKAMDFNTDPPGIVFEYGSDEYQRIQEASKVKDSNCMFGVSFLLLERTTGRFVEWFAGTPSTRPEAKMLFPFLPGTDHGPSPATLKSRLVTGKYSYHVPVVVRCSTPFAVLPDGPTIAGIVGQFVKATGSTAGAEVVADPGRTR